MPQRKSLTKRQSDVLFFIKKKIEEDGLPPTIKNICAEFGFASTNNVSELLQAIEKKGFIKRLSKGASRGIKIIDEDGISATSKALKSPKIKTLPIIGEGNADNALSVFIHAKGQISIDSEFFPISGEYFAAIISDSSLFERGIYEGDFAIVEKRETAETGELVFALVNDSTIARQYEKQSYGYDLKPLHKGFRKIKVKSDDKHVVLLGAIKGIVRKF